MASTICIVDEINANFVDNSATPRGVDRTYRIVVNSVSGNPSPTPDDYRVQAEIDLRLSPLCPLVDFHYGTLYRRNWNINREGSLPDQFLAKVNWDYWKPQDPQDPAATEFFSGGVTRLQTQQNIAFKRIGQYSYGTNTPPKLGGLIGVTTGPEGKVEGTESSVPVLNFSLRQLHPNGTFNLAWLAFAYTFVGKPNSAPWRGFGIGEVMLLSVDGDDSDPDGDELSFSFEARPTQTNIKIPTIAPGPWNLPGIPIDITVPEVRGFDYMWVVTRKQKVLDGELIIDVAEAAYVDQLTDYVNLNLLV